MPLLFGPKNSRYAYTGKPCPHNDLALESNAVDLGEAIREYELQFDVTVRPCAEPLPGETQVKYFSFEENGTGTSTYVDIHVFRDGVEICPLHDMLFKLLSTDLVEMGELIC
jgi:hypothetical protein